MTERTVNFINLPSIGRIEKSGLIVTAILCVVSYVLGSGELAVGTAAGGILFTANFIAIKFFVHMLVGGSHSKGFGIFVFIIKMLIFVGIVFAIFMLAEVNIYGFFIGTTGVVLVIIAESLRGNRDGTL